MPEFVSAEIRGLHGESVTISRERDQLYDREVIAIEVDDRAFNEYANVIVDREGALTLIRHLQAAVNELPGAIVVNVTPAGYYETPGPVRFVRLGGDASLG